MGDARERPHWAGWGAPGEHPLPPQALDFLAKLLGSALPSTPSVARSEVRLGPIALSAEDIAALSAVVGDHHVRIDDEARVLHAGGKCYLDLVRRRSGDALDAPDAVVEPASHDEVLRLLLLCEERDIAVVPFGGGTSVVGGVEPLRGAHHAVVSVDLARMSGVLDLDTDSMLATVGAGTRGPALERALAEHGLTLGHLPQSWEFASIGGYAVTRSAGQASTGYGRFDELLAAVRVVTPRGELTAGRPPASAAGPDLRALFSGSEGALGIVTEVTLRVRRLPQARRYVAFALPSFAAGAAAFRALAQSGETADVMRLSDEVETDVSLALAGVRGVTGAAVRTYLALRGARRPALVVVGFEGEERSVRRRVRAARRLIRAAGGIPLGARPAAAWLAGRFSGPYQRDALLDRGVLVETLETAATWQQLPRVYGAVATALRGALTTADSRPVLMCHVSHVYPTGASLYFTVLAVREGEQPREQWLAAKQAATEAIVRTGGTISHHHAIGIDHLPWLQAEIGPVGVDILRAVKARLDPHDILNPGKLVPAAEDS